MFVVLGIGGSMGRAGCTPPYGTQFFHFHTLFRLEKCPHQGIHAPPKVPRPPTGNPGSATARYEMERDCSTNVWILEFLGVFIPTWENPVNTAYYAVEDFYCESVNLSLIPQWQAVANGLMLKQPAGLSF